MHALFRYSFAALSVVVGAAPAGADIKVALVGDSITRGQWWVNDTTTYPEHLQAMLDTAFGSGAYDIGRYEGPPQGPGFARSGATLRDDGDRPYTEQTAYTASLAYQPDVVVMMFGSNDAKPGINWDTSDHAGETAIFLQDYQSLIDDYDALGSQPDIAVMTPIPVSTEVAGSSSIDAGVVDNQVASAVRNHVANFAEVDAFLDLNLLFPEDNEDFYLSGDIIHPNTDGNAFIARQVFGLLVGGDLNQDHTVGVEDLDVLLANWGDSVSAGDLSRGDASGDGQVGEADLNLVLANWGETPLGHDAAGAAAVPEPASALMLAAGLGLATRRRRK